MNLFRKSCKLLKPYCIWVNEVTFCLISNFSPLPLWAWALHVHMQSVNQQANFLKIAYRSFLGLPKQTTTNGLTQEEFILSQFQRLQVLSQDIGRAGSFCGRGKNLSQAFLLASVSGSPCVCSSAGRHITLSAASVITWHAVSVPSHAVCPLGASLCLLSSPYKDTTHNGLRGHPPPA